VLESSDGKKYVLEKAEPSKIGEWFQEYFVSNISKIRF
jgi:hypothetical protein